MVKDTVNPPASNLIHIQLGKNIRSARLLQGKTQAEVGMAMVPPLTAQQMVKYEAGADRMRVEQLSQIMEILKSNPVQMFKGIADHLPVDDTNNISPRESQIITAYRAIDNEEMRELIVMMVKVCASHMASAFTAMKPN